MFWILQRIATRRLWDDERGQDLVEYALLPEEAFALVVTADRARVVHLGMSAVLRETLAAFAPEDPRAECGEEAARLRALLLDPLDLPERSTRLLPPLRHEWQRFVFFVKQEFP